MTVSQSYLGKKIYFCHFFCFMLLCNEIIVQLLCLQFRKERLKWFLKIDSFYEGLQKMTKVEANKQQKKERLMNTAFHLFTTKGFAHTTIADIAREADMAKGTFYLYFQDKYELQELLISHKSEELFNHAVNYSGYETKATREEKVLALTDDILSQVIRDHSLLRFINKNLNWGIFRTAVERANINYEPVFRDILEVDDLRQVEIIVYTIIELVNSTCHSIILDQQPVDMETYRPYLYEIIKQILTIEPPKASASC